jgi:hypothetical protein
MCPKIAPTITPAHHHAWPAVVAADSVAKAPCHQPAASVGTSPFSTSSTKHASPALGPSTRHTLVAPMFFEPCERISTPRARAIKNPNGMDPHASAMRTKTNQLGDATGMTRTD